MTELAGETHLEQPSNLLDRAPVILDTDIGGDPDDAIAVAVAALTEPALALVVTGNEHLGARARFARRYLNQLGRTDVPVAAGADLGNTRYLLPPLTEHPVPDADGPNSDAAVFAAVSRVCEATAGPIRWIGIGPMSNLATILATLPDLASRLVITQMGGAINYRDPGRAEHNIRLDPEAARTVVHTPGVRIRLVISDTTFTPDIDVSGGGALHSRLIRSGRPAWADTLRGQLDGWFERFHPSTRQHDALTLSAALNLPFVTFRDTTVTFDEIGRMREDPDGVPVRLSSGAQYPQFMTWLHTTLIGDRGQSAG